MPGGDVVTGSVSQLRDAPGAGFTPCKSRRAEHSSGILRGRIRRLAPGFAEKNLSAMADKTGRRPLAGAARALEAQVRARGGDLNRANAGREVHSRCEQLGERR